MFGKSFKPAKCKTALRLAISRIKLLKNKKDLHLKQMRRDLAQLLQSGQEPSAMIQVEHLIREQNTVGAYEFIEIFCELIVARLPMIESQKNCPIDLLEAISTLIFTAPRCADIPELAEIRSHFGSKYGKEFVASAAELRPECGVNRTVIEKLSARTPNGEQKLKVMKEIAKEHQIKWDPSESEKDLLKPPEDLLNGPSKFVGATKFPTEHKKESYQSVSGNKCEPEFQVFASKMPNSSGHSHSAEATNYGASSVNNISKSSNTLGMPPTEDSQSEKRNRMDSFVSRGNVEKKHIQAPASENNMKATNLHQETIEKRPFESLSSGKRNTSIPRNTLGDEYDSSQQSASYKIDQSNGSVDSSNVSSEREVSNNKDWNMKFKDAASAAQAAAYSAERASEAAKAAAELSKHSTLKKKYSRKTGLTSNSSSSDEEMMELNNLRTSSRPGSNEYVQPEDQTFHGNDLSGKHHVESDNENLKSDNSATWQSNQQKETGKIDDGYELPMKSIRRLESYQWPSDEITGDDSVHGVKESAYVRREERQYIDIKEEKSYARKDSDFSNSVDGSGLWKRDPISLHSNTQPSEDFNVSFNRKPKSVEEFESKRAEDRSNAVDEFPLFNVSPQNLQSDNKWSHQKSKDGPAVKASCMDEAHSNLYQSNSAFQLPMRSPPDVFQSTNSHMQNSFSNNSRPLDKVSTQPGNASYDSSASDDDMSNPMPRGKSGSDVLIESANWPFNDHDHSGRYLVETNERNAKSQRKAHQQNELVNAGQEYLSMKRTGRTDFYHQPSNRIDHDKPFADKSQPLRKQGDQVSSSRASRKQTDIRKSVEEPLLRKGDKVDSRANAQASDMVGDIDGMESDNEYDMSMKRTVNTGLHQQPSNRIYDESKTYAVKSQSLRRQQEKQVNTGGAIRKQTDSPKLIVEPLLKKGNTVDSCSNTQAFEICSDSDSMESESDEETELETHNESSGNIHGFPLSGNSSHNASPNTKRGNPKLTGNLSTPTPSSVNETHAHLSLSQSNLRFQPSKQSLSGPTTSSQTSFQSPSSVGESKAQKDNSSRRAAHVHPKLPDYDDLAAKFKSMKRQ